MHHDELRELAASYALDALSGDEREAFERHLTMCPECDVEVASLRGTVFELAYAAPFRPAPPLLRSRVLAAMEAAAAGAPQAIAPAGVPPAIAPVTPRRSASRAWWLAAAAALGAILVAGYAMALRAHVGVLDQELREARAQAQSAQRELVDAQSQLARGRVEMQRVNLTTTILAAPDVIQVNLQGEAAAPSAIGRAFWSQSRGILFTANALPPLPESQVYQLWMVTAAGPLSAGLLTPDTNGRALVVADPTTTDRPAAFAVTVEPAGGLPAPTGARVLVGAL